MCCFSALLHGYSPTWDGHLLTTTDLTSVTPLPAARIIHHALDDVHWLRYPTVNLYSLAIISVPAVELGFTFGTAVTAFPQRLFCGLSLFPHSASPIGIPPSKFFTVTGSILLRPRSQAPLLTRPLLSGWHGGLGPDRCCLHL